MRILHVIDQISQTLHGGSAKVPYQLAREQAKLGHEVTIFTSDHQAKEQQPPEGVKLYKFKTVACYQNLVFTPGMYFRNYRQFDIVHLHNYRVLTNIIACDSFHGPLILQAHGNAVAWSGKKWPKPFFDAVWRNLILKKCSWFIADADSEIGQYVSEGAKLECIRLIPIGIDLEEFAKVPMKHDETRKTVLFLGRLDRIKGVDLLIKAFSRLENKDCTLTIAGPDSGFGNELKKLVEDLKLSDRAHFIGPVYDYDKLETYANADVVVMPSRYETWGITFMEALACGKPVIMTENCEASKILPKECGIVVPFNEMNLAGAIHDVLANGYSEKYADFRKEWVSQYSWEGIAKKTIELYKEVLTERCLSR